MGCHFIGPGLALGLAFSTTPALCLLLTLQHAADNTVRACREHDAGIVWKHPLSLSGEAKCGPIGQNPHAHGWGCLLGVGKRVGSMFQELLPVVAQAEYIWMATQTWMVAWAKRPVPAGLSRQGFIGRPQWEALQILLYRKIPNLRKLPLPNSTFWKSVVSAQLCPSHEAHHRFTLKKCFFPLCQPVTTEPWKSWRQGFFFFGDDGMRNLMVKNSHKSHQPTEGPRAVAQK